MKKIILVFIILCFASCRHENTLDNNNNVTLTKDEYEILKIRDHEYPKPFSVTDGIQNSYSIVLGSDNHEYLCDRNGYVVLHTPECKKCSDKHLYVNLINDSIK